MIEDLLQRIIAPPPLQGLSEGVDSALPDNLFSPLFTPDALNIRVVNGLFETRKGMALWDPDANASTTTFGATGFPNLLANYYKSDGTIYRLAAINGALRQMASAGSAFANATNGTGLSASSPWSGITLSDLFYFSDRSAAFKRYDPSNGVASVAQPTKPTAAPRVKPWQYGVLVNWTGSAPFGFTESDNTHFNVTAASGSTDPNFPVAGTSVKVTCTDNNSKNDTITKDATYPLNSATIAFWVESDYKNHPMALQIGINASDDFSWLLSPLPEKNESYVYFAGVGDLPTIAHLRFKVTKDPSNTKHLFVSPLFLPGRLDGKYRYRYSHYNPSTGAESTPSDINDSGQPLDLSTLGISFKNETSRAFQKCAMLDFTSDAGSDASTTKIRIYRNGGVPSLTKDSRGQDVWLRVGEIYDFSTTVSGSPSAGATSFSVASAGNIAAGDYLVLKKDSATEEYVYVDSIASTTITCTTTPLKNNHSNGESVQIAFLDNTSNQALAGSVNVIDAERDDPPAGVHWVDKAPDGRLWLFRYSGKRLGVAVSNRATVERPFDHEVFPNGVDPLTRGHPTQGWRFNVAGDASGDEIVWGGFFNGIPTVLTRRALYQIDAYSQDQWSPTSVRKVLEVGCICGETVQIVNDTLIWCSDGPTVMAWTGQGAPKDISYQRITNYLRNAPTAYWNQWFGRGRKDPQGQEYWLFMTPNGGTTNTQVLRYNFNGDSWEPHVYNNGADVAWGNAVQWRGAGDNFEFYAAHASSGNAYLMESGTTDAGTAIVYRVKTKRFRFPEDLVGQIERVWVRGAAVSDSFTITVYVGGSEYGDQSSAYSSLSFSGVGDKEQWTRADYSTLHGRWVQVQLSGTISNGFAPRDLMLDWTPHRRTRVTA